jgi:hypothetical protein
VFEVAIAGLVFVYLLLLAVPTIELQVVLGTIAALVGLVGGGGAGIVYHLVLREALLPSKRGTRGWLWSPVSRHADLDEPARRRVLPWFRAGAAGFLLCIAGIGMVGVAAIRAWLAG